MEKAVDILKKTYFSNTLYTNIQTQPILIEYQSMKSRLCQLSPVKMEPTEITLLPHLESMLHNSLQMICLIFYPQFKNYSYIRAWLTLCSQWMLIKQLWWTKLIDLTRRAEFENTKSSSFKADIISQKHHSTSQKISVLNIKCNYLFLALKFSSQIS